MLDEHDRTLIHPSACVDEGAVLGRGTRVWHFTHVMSGAVLGEGCTVGQNVFIASGARLGRGVKVQNNVSLYDGVELGDFVFCGPSVVFTNVWNPRAELDRRDEYRSTVVGRGATLGANATIVCGVRIGRHAFVGAGAVVTRDIPDYALFVGVPAAMDGYMSRHGHRLVTDGDAGGEAGAEAGGANASGFWRCPVSGFRYREEGGALRCLDLDEDGDLPRETR